MAGVTSGIRVLELGEGIAVAYCGKLFADYGAEVIKVEPPGGDGLRNAGPFRDGVPPGDDSGLFAFLNTSKNSVTIDIETVDGRSLLDRLADRADLVVHSLRHHERTAVGLDAGDGSDRPFIEVSITPFGLNGPYRDFAAEPLTMAALAGWMFPMGDHDKPPLYPGGPYISYLSGATAAASGLLALEARRETGVSQVVDVSELEVGLTGLPFDTVRFSYSGYIRPRSDELYSDNPTAAIYPCADGYVQFQEIRRLEEFLELIGGDRLASDPRLRNADLRSLNRDVLREAFLSFLADKKRWELFEECGQRRIVLAPVPDMREIYELQPHREREYFQPGHGEALDRVEIPGPPVRFDNAEWHAEAAPRLGGDNDTVFESLGIPAETVDALREGGRI